MNINIFIIKIKGVYGIMNIGTFVYNFCKALSFCHDNMLIFGEKVVM